MAAAWFMLDQVGISKMSLIFQFTAYGIASAIFKEAVKKPVFGIRSGQTPNNYMEGSGSATIK